MVHVRRYRRICREITVIHFPRNTNPFRNLRNTTKGLSSTNPKSTCQTCEGIADLRKWYHFCSQLQKSLISSLPRSYSHLPATDSPSGGQAGRFYKGLYITITQGIHKTCQRQPPPKVCIYIPKVCIYLETPKICMQMSVQDRITIISANCDISNSSLRKFLFSDGQHHRSSGSFKKLRRSLSRPPANTPIRAYAHTK